MPSSDFPSTDSTSLLCASTVIGHECANVNKDFWVCKENYKNPRACLMQGERVTGCVIKV